MQSWLPHDEKKDDKSAAVAVAAAAAWGRLGANNQRKLQQHC
jgi:hypothetical protein